MHRHPFYMAPDEVDEDLMEEDFLDDEIEDEEFTDEDSTHLPGLRPEDEAPAGQLKLYSFPFRLMA